MESADQYSAGGGGSANRVRRSLVHFYLDQKIICASVVLDIRHSINEKV